MTMRCKNELDEPTPEELIEVLQHVNEALHRLGGAWQVLPGTVRSRLLGESQRIEDILDRAGALPTRSSLSSRDHRLRHLPPPRPAAEQTKPLVLGHRHKPGPHTQLPSVAAAAEKR
jgi:hypothetical protein